MVELINDLAAYFAQTALLLDIGCSWHLGDVPDREGYRQSLLRFPAGAELAVENMVSDILMRAVSGDAPAAARAAAPDGLRRPLDMRAKFPTADQPVAATFEIHPDGVDSYHVTFADEVDDGISERLDDLVDVLNERFDATAIREHRDVILVQRWERGVNALTACLALWYGHP